MGWLNYFNRCPVPGLNLLREYVRPDETHHCSACWLTVAVFITIVTYTSLLIVELQTTVIHNSLTQISSQPERFTFTCECSIGCAVTLFGDCSANATRNAGNNFLPLAAKMELPTNISTQWLSSGPSGFLTKGHSITFSLCAGPLDYFVVAGISAGAYGINSYIGLCPNTPFNDNNQGVSESLTLGYVGHASESQRFPIYAHVPPSQGQYLVSHYQPLSGSETVASIPMQPSTLDTSYCHIYDLYSLSGLPLSGYDTICSSMSLYGLEVVQYDTSLSTLSVFGSAGGICTASLLAARILMVIVRKWICPASLEVKAARIRQISMV